MYDDSAESALLWSLPRGMDQAWRAVAAQQCDHITRAQLLRTGRSAAWINRALDGGLLVRVGRGVYRAGTAEASWLGDLWAEALAAGPYCFVFRRSAAALWEFDGFPPDDIELGLRRGRNVRRGTAAHRVATLVPGDVVRRDGLRVTSPIRTLQDLAALGDTDRLERALESALRRKLITEADLSARPAPAPNCGRTVWLSLLATRPAGAPATESDAETRFLQLCRSAGLPEPRRQHEVQLGTRFRLDFAWPEVALAVEIDGRSVHGPDALGPDLRRQNRIQLAGWLILRFTFEDVVRYPEETVDSLRRAFRLVALGAS